MRKFEDLNYYEIFEIPVNASSFEIRQAYRNALSIYGDDSDIAYAFFNREERAKILQRIEAAFSTLISDHKREAYDKTLVANKIIDPSSLAKKSPKVATPLFAAKSAGGEAISKKIERAIREKKLKALADEILSMDAVSGKDLQRLRTAVGITIEDVFEVTRISVATLEAIENDHIDALPPIVYLRNFLKAYTELFEADAQKIIAGYLKKPPAYPCVFVNAATSIALHIPIPAPLRQAREEVHGRFRCLPGHGTHAACRRKERPAGNLIQIQAPLTDVPKALFQP